MRHTFDWNDIDTVLLDMDGTLLDLYFDNFFWLEYLPQYWGEINGFGPDTAKEILRDRYQQEKGTLSWYCLDFWSRQLEIDVFLLKYDVEHLIQFRPFAREFLDLLAKSGKQRIMVTNAHQKLIAMKEEIRFWESLDRVAKYQRERTLLIDDNLTVLRTAQNHGIKYLLGIARPDSNQPAQDTEEFIAVHSFRELGAGIEDSHLSA